MPVPSFYRIADGILCCFDLTNRRTFETIELWLNEAKKAGFLGQPLLVGCKKDLVHKREVSQREIEKFTRKWKLYYIETSSKTGENVEAAFLKLGKIIHKYYSKHKDEIKEVELKTENKNSKCILS